jgi:Tol biopolymer transport system component
MNRIKIATVAAAAVAPQVPPRIRIAPRVMSRPSIYVVATCLVVAATLLMAGSAFAAFPGSNGQIAAVHLSGAPGSNQDIFAFGPGGEQRIQLTDTADDDAFPSYSADGERIVFSRGPDGSEGNGEIWVMNADGSGQTRLTSGPAAANDHDPVISPDGKRIAFTREVSGQNQIWVMNANGSNQTQITFTNGAGDRGSGPVFSPDGSKIIFVMFDGAVGYHAIAVMNPDGSGQTALTTPSAGFDAFQPDVSPDGQRIVFDRFDQSQDDLWIMNADGSGQAALTSGSNYWDLSPAFAPDGDKVVFERNAPGFTVANIFTVDPTGVDQNPTPLTSNAAPVQDFEPGWQPLNPPSCELGGKASSKSIKRIRVRVKCVNENATVTVRGSGKAPWARRSAVAAKTRKFKLPAVTVKVKRGVRKTIKLKVSKKGRRALKKALQTGKKGTAKIVATSTDDLGQRSKDSRKVKFKPSK